VGGPRFSTAIARGGPGRRRDGHGAPAHITLRAFALRRLACGAAGRPGASQNGHAPAAAASRFGTPAGRR